MSAATSGNDAAAPTPVAISSRPTSAARVSRADVADFLVGQAESGTFVRAAVVLGPERR
ncbi:hypothetical protein [Actinacidiphila acidipaludis]|uniref:Uncharacterized protein n=1 Tax=Actinacidiphila acidipaludis TaxID=2873382 RepID=A0ABS7QI54_9ACTN|nr:hypothetical protein [Streptomyces acidipaludis]MBY8881459.1 hypothetical protein [Streptomyces acidipaludis]